MPAIRPAKKNGTIEVRLPDETKAAFMERCRRDGATASEVIRMFIDERLAPSNAARSLRIANRRAILAGTLGLVLGVGVAAPSFAHGALERSTFEQLDRNHDGVLSRQEFHRG
jgi:hypothetical protein